MNRNPSMPGTKEFVDWMLSTLPPRHEKILRERYGLWKGGGSTLQAIGEQYGLTRERIRQIEAKSIEKLGKLVAPTHLTRFVTVKLAHQAGPQLGVALGRREAACLFADDCTVDQADLALAFLKAVSGSNTTIFPDFIPEPHDCKATAIAAAADEGMIERRVEKSIKKILKLGRSLLHHPNSTPQQKAFAERLLAFFGGEVAT